MLVLTPHLNVSRGDEAPYERHLAFSRSFETVAPRAAGAAARLGDHARRTERRSPLAASRLGGSRAVLVEFPHSGVPLTGGRGALSHPRASGVVPVLAHPERYWGCTVEQRGAVARCRRGDPDGYRRSPRQGRDREAVARAARGRAGRSVQRATITATPARSPPRATGCARSRRPNTPSC